MHWRSFCIGAFVPRLFVGGTRGEVEIQVFVSSCTWLGVLIHPVSCSHFCRAIPFFSIAAVLPFFLPMLLSGPKISILFGEQ